MSDGGWLVEPVSLTTRHEWWCGSDDSMSVQLASFAAFHVERSLPVPIPGFSAPLSTALHHAVETGP